MASYFWVYLNWQFINKGNGYEVVAAFAVWSCLDSNYAGNVYTLACNGGNYQRWDATYKGVRWSNTYQHNYDVYEIRNRQTGLCLDSNIWNSVYTLGCNGGDYQRWFQL